MQKINCAIYVRKSTEKGLDMEFNSLHNQEEACKNYILSQTFNGWEHYKTYTDGGISGGTMNRPELLMMMEDIKKGLIQIVVSYKVDRLSRSIFDFHNMMKEFEKYNCNFVSITQAFDTSTSMGKLTLNMLLSFAQFEREVSGERVRDKIAASKEKGLWTGGPPPFGYDVIDKKLVPNEKEAEQVRLIFEKYLEIGSLSKLRAYLENNNIKGKKWKTNKGIEKGGQNFYCSMLAKLLRSKLYIGKIENQKKKTFYDGQHTPIIDRKLFNAVSALMDGNRNKENESYDWDAYLLSGKIYDNNGNQFKNQKSSKNSVKKYRYYSLKGNYLPAGDIEKITIQVVRSLFYYPLDRILNESQNLEFRTIDFDLLTLPEKDRLAREMIEKIIYNNNKLIYFIKIDDLAYLKAFRKENFINAKIEDDNGGHKIYPSEDGRNIIIEKEICPGRHPSSSRYIGNGKLISIEENNHSLVKALSVGWGYGKMQMNGLTVSKITDDKQIAERTVYKYLNLNCLSPKIVNSIMDGNAPANINPQVLFEIVLKCMDFEEQEKVFYSHISK